MAAELNAPAFYTHQRESLRPAVLIYAAALATVLWAAVFVLIGHSADRGSFFIGTHRAAEPAIGSFQRPRDPAEPDVATRLNPEPDDPLADYKKAYFRTILVLLAIDTDHNYVISAAEIANAPSALSRLDRNHDGSLSAEECGAYFGRAISVPGLTVVDKNQNGRLQKGQGSKRPQGSSARGEADHAPDLKTEQNARLAFMRFHPVLAALDADHDGIISPVELRNAPAALRRLDRNGDGHLSAAEVMPDPVAREVGRIMLLDRDADGSISKAERNNPWGEKLRDFLNEADRNRDGIVTEDEVRAAIQRSQQ